ncbi:hypothetical protein P6B95_20305 [Streptomyces atratus]|uniref:hypothetical protein n=1 Tax=Streptomyces atratus TaxID=1893 RepID=UPI002AC34BD0|nr:hypothetical protein [Streptomyces atratus]WPW29489.1 hypothetical protein P6B95_20305 [Streptomyces atratus]
MSEAHTADGNAVLINALSSSMRRTMNGMETVPGLVRQIIEEGSWRNFISPRGEQVQHTTFESFVTAKPTRGLGYTIQELARLLADEPETLAQIAELTGRPLAELQQDATGDTATTAAGAAPRQEVLWRDPSDDLEATAGDQPPPEPDLNLDDPVDRDAYELRSVGKSGGWVWALKVARNVYVGAASQPSEDDAHGARADSGKVSASEFARRIGWSTPRVMRYYRAWEQGIHKLGLPHFDELAPGHEVPLPAANTWSECFTPGRVSPDRADALTAGAHAAGLSVREVIYAAKSPGAMKAAILADESTAEAARSAVLERARNDHEYRAALARTIACEPVFRKETAVETRKAERAEYVRHAATDGKIRTPAGQTIELAPSEKQDANELLSIVDRPDATAEDVTGAYEALQDLAARTLEAAPDLQLREHRAKLTKALTAISKGLQAIDPNHLTTAADDDLKSKLVDLHKQITDLTTAVTGETKKHLRVIGPKATGTDG